MLFTDTYQTIIEDGHAEIRESGSRFIAYAFHVNSEDEFKKRLQELKKEHHSATHHCWALVIGSGKEFQKFSDDREPANSAGRPILRAILSKELTFIAIVVVRYFGGKLLGIPGLIKAYEASTKAAIDSSAIVSEIIKETYQVTGPGIQAHEVFRVAKQFGIKLKIEIQAEDLLIIFDVRRSEADKVIKSLQEIHQLKITPYATKSH